MDFSVFFFLKLYLVDPNPCDLKERKREKHGDTDALQFVIVFDCHVGCHLLC